jgi:hypothetical protein
LIEKYQKILTVNILRAGINQITLQKALKKTRIFTGIFRQLKILKLSAYQTEAFELRYIFIFLRGCEARATLVAIPINKPLTKAKVQV